MKLKIKSGHYGHEMTIDPFSDKSLKDALSDVLIENLVNNTDVRYTQLSLRPVAAEADDTQKQEEALPAPENIPDGFYVSINDNIYKRNGSVLVEAKGKAARRLQKRKGNAHSCDRPCQRFEVCCKHSKHRHIG
ncbi:MAG: hypothetical protein ACLVAU_13435 [Ruminococcus sp.]